MVVTESRTSPRAVIAGISSGIGSAAAERLIVRGWTVAGTSRTPSGYVGSAKYVIPCDFAKTESIDSAAESLMGPWNLLIIAPGTMNPISPFLESDMNDWERSFQINLLGPLRFVQRILSADSVSRPSGAHCIFFSGGGTNSVPQAVSAYTIAKVALIKAAEALDAEMDDIAFSVLGPGWVRTRIHQEALQADRAPAHLLNETRRRLAEDDFNPMTKVLDFIDWIYAMPKSVVGGRNFSVSGDPIHEPELRTRLEGHPDAYRLRRHLNDTQILNTHG